MNLSKNFYPQKDNISVATRNIPARYYSFVRKSSLLATRGRGKDWVANPCPLGLTDAPKMCPSASEPFKAQSPSRRRPERPTQAVPLINVSFQGSGQPPCGAEIVLS